MCGIYFYCKTCKPQQMAVNLYSYYVQSQYYESHPIALESLLESMQPIKESPMERVDEVLKDRGPSQQQFEVVQHGGLQLHLYQSLLHLRGDEGAPVKQPYEHGGNLLLFNGEIYEVGGHVLDPFVSDTRVLAELLTD